MVYYAYLHDTLSSDGGAVLSAALYYAAGGLLAFLLMGLGGRVFCALAKGDAERFGLSFNPVKSLSVGSLLGLSAFPFFGLGWGKTPSLDPENRGKSFLVSLGGPLFCLLGSVIFLLLYGIDTGVAFVGSLLMGAATACVAFGLFGLLPLPGLWGGLLVASLLPEGKAEKWDSLRKYAPFFITLALLLLTRSELHTAVISKVVNALAGIVS